eukprot:597228-Prorocentrum_minimum.AAC.1
MRTAGSSSSSTSRSHSNSSSRVGRGEEGASSSSSSSGRSSGSSGSIISSCSGGSSSGSSSGRSSGSTAEEKEIEISGIILTDDGSAFVPSSGGGEVWVIRRWVADSQESGPKRGRGMTLVEPARPYSVVATRRHGRGAPGPSCSTSGARTAPTRPQGQGILLLAI